jgi:hypothetical protein
MELLMTTLCPEDETLADYLEGRLSDEERFQVEQHVSDCDMCVNRLVIASDLIQRGEQLDLDTVPSAVTEAAVGLMQREHRVSRESFPETLRRSVKDFSTRLSDFLRFRPPAVWQPQPIRGTKEPKGKELVHLRKTFKDIDTEIEIEKTGADKANIRVVFPEDSGAWRGVRITLKKGPREIFSYLADEAYVLFENIPFGHYTLELTRDGTLLGTYSCEIRDTGHGRR